ncbi:MAG: NAD-binding protein, partial [Gemmatimonadales bacterium]
ATLAKHAELKPLVRAAPVVIVGMGSVGRGVADALRTFHIQYFAMERDPQRLRLALADGYEVSSAMDSMCASGNPLTCTRES